MDEKKLLKYSIDYLSKYDSSKQNLSNVLKRKIFRLQLTNIEKAKIINNIKNIILKLEENNLIDDKKYSISKILSFSQAGKSKKFIYYYLLKKGVSKLQIQNSLVSFEQDNNSWELNSAKSFAKKKRLLKSNIDYNKKLAKMARAGFSYEICKKVLG
tara:strand:+ start:134 stop:604 length:471 start_codon:yes stop_codon:yes gene_type:complete